MDSPKTIFSSPSAKTILGDKVAATTNVKTADNATNIENELANRGPTMANPIRIAAGQPRRYPPPMYTDFSADDQRRSLDAATPHFQIYSSMSHLDNFVKDH